MKHFVLILSLWLATFAVKAETIILQYDPSCMDMYEMRNPSGSIRLLSFSPHTLSATERVVLEVGAGKGQRVSSKPRLLTECGSLTIALRLVQRINDHSTEMYIARPDGSGYVLYRVEKAYYYFPKGGEIEFYGADTHFRFDPAAPARGRDLALPDSKTSVYFTAQVPYACFTGYAFRKIHRTDRSVVKAFHLVPEIGIVEKSAGSAEYGLKLVNGAIFDHFLKVQCASRQVASYDQMPKGHVAPPPTVYSQPEKREAYAPRHVVQAGETLYGIARHYGISLQDLVSWNQLTTHIIKPGMELFVAPPPSSSVSTPAESAFSDTEAEQRDYTARGVRSVSAPPAPPVAEEEEIPAWVDPPAYHIVQPGETVAQIAERYGYTEARFRWMNDLEPHMRIYPGMRLRTSDCQLIVPPEARRLGQRPKGGGYRTEPVPYEEVQQPAPQPAPPPAIDYSKLRIHIVSEGETLYEIASRYHMSLEELLRINNMRKGEVLLPNQRLYVR